MTLRCECGGSVEAVDIETGRHGGVSEHYECQSCGRSGGYGVDGMTNDRRTWGCVVRV